MSESSVEYDSDRNNNSSFLESNNGTKFSKVKIFISMSCMFISTMVLAGSVILYEGVEYKILKSSLIFMMLKGAYNFLYLWLYLAEVKTDIKCFKFLIGQDSSKKRARLITSTIMTYISIIVEVSLLENKYKHSIDNKGRAAVWVFNSIIIFFSTLSSAVLIVECIILSKKKTKDAEMEMEEIGDDFKEMIHSSSKSSSFENEYNKAEEEVKKMLNVKEAPPIEIRSVEIEDDDKEICISDPGNSTWYSVDSGESLI